VFYYLKQLEPIFAIFGTHDIPKTIAYNFVLLHYTVKYISNRVGTLFSSGWVALK